MKKESVFEYMKMTIASIEHIYKRAIELGLEDTQEFLDWLDKLNEISVRR